MISGKRVVSGSLRQSEGTSKVKIENLPPLCYNMNVSLFEALLQIGKHPSKDAVTVWHRETKEPGAQRR